jgi:hypothetical protein
MEAGSFHPNEKRHTLSDEQIAVTDGIELLITIDEEESFDPHQSPIEVEDRGGTKMMRAIGRPVSGSSKGYVAQMNSIRISSGAPQKADLPEVVLIARRNEDSVASLDEVDTTLGYTYHWSGEDHGTFMDARYLNPRRAMVTLRTALQAALAVGHFPLNLRVGHLMRRSMHSLHEKGVREIRTLWVVSDGEARHLLRIVNGVLGS